MEHAHALHLPGRNDLLTPWSIHAEATALSAFAQYGEGDDGVELWESLAAKARDVLDPQRPFMDYPVAGLALVGIGVWALLKQPSRVADAVRLLVLGNRFAYPGFAPTMRWERMRVLCDERAPGLVDTLQAEYAGRRGPDLIDQARAAVEQIL
ncbi:hypothetical protein [Nocardioides alcanivorans]|uniref:hypothetical protein n=1 Tax=Nocardioides alcanivorans TaxID=2897352 RepID=UPI001F322317|nr:hypothetical protein [Nocardioides alcanivorans]